MLYVRYLTSNFELRVGLRFAQFNVRRSSNPTYLWSSVRCCLVAKVEACLKISVWWSRPRARAWEVWAWAAIWRDHWWCIPFNPLLTTPNPSVFSITSTAWGGNERSTSLCSRRNTITMNRWVAIMPCISSVRLARSTLHPSVCCCLFIRQSAPELDSAR